MMHEFEQNELPFLSLDELLNDQTIPFADEETHEIVDAILPDSPILTEPVRQFIENPSFIQETLDTIDAVDEYAWNRGVMGLDSGFESINKAFNGLNTGVVIIGGPSNSGS